MVRVGFAGWAGVALPDGPDWFCWMGRDVFARWAGLAVPDGLAAPKMCIFRTCLKTFSWKSKMKNVVKYCVYLDILLTGSIYVTKY